MALDPKAFGFASAAVTALVDAAGFVWHGLLGQPSVMGMLYPGFWSNPVLLALGFVGTVAAAYALGYVFAWKYNRFSRK